MTGQLLGVPETLLITLWARAVETGRDAPILRDEKAVDMVARIPYDFTRFAKSWLSQVGVATRARLIDQFVDGRLARHPDTTVVNLGAGLDTRYHRLKNRPAAWYELDLPESMAVRRRFLEEGGAYRYIETSMFDVSWMDRVADAGRPALLIAEGLLMYFEEAQLRPLFGAMARRFPGGDLVCDILPPIFVGKSRRHDSVSKIDGAAEFKWGVRRSRDLEAWDPAISFVKECNLVDHNKPRWRWYGHVARLPVLRPHLACRVAHFRFRSQPDQP